MSKVARDLIAARANPAPPASAAHEGLVHRRPSKGAGLGGMAPQQHAHPGKSQTMDTAQYITVLKQRLDEQKKELEDRTVAINSVQRNFESLSEIYSSEKNSLHANARRAQELEQELRRLKADVASNYIPKKEYVAVEMELKQVKDAAQNDLVTKEEALRVASEKLRGREVEVRKLTAKLKALEGAQTDTRGALSDTESAVYDCENSLKALLDLLDVSTSTLYADAAPPMKAPHRTSSGRLIQTTSRTSAGGPVGLNAPSGFTVPVFKRDTNDWEALKCLPVSSRVLAVAEMMGKLTQAASLPSVFAFCSDILQESRKDVQEVWAERTRLGEDFDALRAKYASLEVAVLEVDAEKANASRALQAQRAVQAELTAALAEQTEKAKELESALKAARRNVEEKAHDAVVLAEERDKALRETNALREEHRALWEEYQGSRDLYRSSEEEFLRRMHEKEESLQREVKVLQNCHKAELAAMQRAGATNAGDLSRKQDELDKLLCQREELERLQAEVTRKTEEDKARLAEELDVARSMAFDFKQALETEKEREKAREHDFEGLKRQYLLQVDGAEGDRRRLEDAVERLTVLLNKAQDESDALKQRLAAAAGNSSAAVVELERQVGVREKQVASVRNALDRAAVERAEAEKAWDMRLADAAHEKAAVEDSLAASELAGAALQGRVDDLEAETESLRREVKELEESTSRNASEIEAELAAKVKECRMMEDDHASLLASLEQERQSVAHLRQSLAAAEEEVLGADRKRAQVVTGLEARLDDLKARNEEVEAALTAKLNEVKTLRKNSVADANAHAELAKLRASLEEERQHAADTKRKQEEVDGVLADLKLVQAETAKTLRKLLASEEASESAYTCLSCFNIMKDPHLCTPCGHTFCGGCMDKAAKKRTGARGESYCLECEEHCVVEATPLKALDQLIGRYTYRKQVLHDLENALVATTGRRQSLAGA
eukprot:TRINITY_DN16284_c0_g3_i1.p1 TRINITY_DN16284_c0_g3~~TRINITY_DN16284_c0_g3_i1.p1  ORF type:complete len:957 (+),score=287.80 TRINITY_DN16284_c0_g3_i1:97-2967(+)